MKNIKELNDAKVPIIKIDESLKEFKDKQRFKKKVDKINDILRTVGLPEELTQVKET
jgi:methionine synthase II (cobalamin-independent)